MSRLPAVLPVLVVLLASTAAAPVPKGAPPEPPYYPTKIGTKWVFKSGGSEHSQVITAAKKQGGATIVTIDTLVSGKVVTTEKLSVSEKGVHRVELQGAADNPPVCLLKLPYKPGETWESVDTSTNGKRFTKAFTALEPEGIEVQAGKYKAARVEYTHTLFGRPTQVVCWYAQGVGLVKMTAVGPGGVSAVELKSFTPGKD